jgi:hypothetical protein
VRVSECECVYTISFFAPKTFILFLSQVFPCTSCSIVEKRFVEINLKISIYFLSALHLNLCMRFNFLTKLAIFLTTEK